MLCAACSISELAIKVSVWPFPVATYDFTQKAE